MAHDQQIMTALRQFIAESPPEEVRDGFRPGGDALQYVALLETPDNFHQIMFEKNLKVFGGINEYVEDFMPAILDQLRRIPLAERESRKEGARAIVQRMLATEGLSAENREGLQQAMSGPLASHTTAPAAGKRRRRRKTRRV